MMWQCHDHFTAMQELFSLTSFISDPLIFMCLPADKPELSEPPVTVGGKIPF